MNTIGLKSFRLAAIWILICQVFTIQAFTQWSTDPTVNNIITDKYQPAKCLSDSQ